MTAGKAVTSAGKLALGGDALFANVIVAILDTGHAFTEHVASGGIKTITAMEREAGRAVITTQIGCLASLRYGRLVTAEEVAGLLSIGKALDQKASMREVRNAMAVWGAR